MKKEFTKKQLQQSFDDGIGAGKSGVEALVKEANEQHAKEIADIKVAVEERKEAYLLEIDGFKKRDMENSLAHDEQIIKFKEQIEEQVKKVDEINKSATEQINGLRIKCQELAAVIKLLARQI